VKGELATPTGVAILTSVVAEYVTTPTMTIAKIGHGAGTKDPIEQPNMLRLLVGTTTGSSDADTVTILETNLDDCPGEVIGFAMERLFTAGALDVFTMPIQMKKNRPGVLLSVICEPAKVSEMEAILFRETATFGIRRTTAHRTKLHREAITVTTKWGDVKAKRGHRDSFTIITPEYEDCARIAREHSVPLRELYEEVRRVSRL
jgi:pyridinium-3,5-bisthiocarboxylic acid mononucleotide nickel chelatase